MALPRRKRRSVGAVGLYVGVLLASACGPGTSDEATSGSPSLSSSSGSASAPGSSTASASLSTSVAPHLKHLPSTLPSDETKMVQDTDITGTITPKSVDASGDGRVIANNMIYSHSMTFYDTDSRKLIATTPDTVNLESFGFTGFPGNTTGGPVEAAWTKDHKHVYVTNYMMTGAGNHYDAFDACGPSDHIPASYLYRVDTSTYKIDQVIKVGAVPKYVAITPDQKTVLVSNWCDWQLGIVDVASAKQVATIPVGRNPRGIVASPDSKTAYVAAFSTSNLYKVDLRTHDVSVMATPGRATRHVTMSPDAKWLYVVAAWGDTVSKIDRETGKIVAVTHTGREPRSMTISSDGTAIYVVDYFANKAQKIRTSDMTVVQEVKTYVEPIGITFDPITRSVWIASYSGHIQVFDDNAPAD